VVNNKYYIELGRLDKQKLQLEEYLTVSVNYYNNYNNLLRNLASTNNSIFNHLTLNVKQFQVVSYVVILHYTKLGY